MGRSDWSWDRYAAERRDRRNIKEEDDSSPKSARKDTKKWCKGVEGREHKGVVYPAKDFFRFSTAGILLVCSVCGKRLDYFRKARKGHPIPEWVEAYRKSRKEA